MEGNGHQTEPLSAPNLSHVTIASRPWQSFERSHRPPPAAQSPGRSLDHDLRNECWCRDPHSFPLSCSFSLVGRPLASRLPFQHLPPALSSVGRKEPGVGLEPYMFLSLMYKCWWASVPFMKEGKCVWRTRGLPRLRNRLFFLLALY